jgi:hypothetical protein
VSKKQETGTRFGEYTFRTLYKTIDVDFANNTEEQNLKNVERFYDIYRYPPKDILEKQYQRYLSLPQKVDEKYLCQMIQCFEKTYGRYFDDTAEYWKEKDKVIQKEIELVMEKANEESLKLFKKEDPYEIRACKDVLDYYQRPPDKNETGQVLKYKSLIKTNFSYWI